MGHVGISDGVGSVQSNVGIGSQHTSRIKTAGNSLDITALSPVDGITTIQAVERGRVYYDEYQRAIHRTGQALSAAATRIQSITNGFVRVDQLGETDMRQTTAHIGGTPSQSVW